MNCAPASPLLVATSARLLEAQNAYHALMIGTSVVKVRDQNGEEITYSQASAPKLLEYIKTLQDALDPSVRINAPMRFMF